MPVAEPSAARRNRLVHALTVLVAVPTAAVAVWAVAARLTDVPVMHVDAATGDCVAIYSTNPDHTCTNPPLRYHREVIAPVPARETYRDPHAPIDPAEVARRLELEQFREEQRRYLANLRPGEAGKDGEAEQPLPAPPSTPTDLQVERLATPATTEPAAAAPLASDDAGDDGTQLAAAGPVYTFTHTGGRPAAHHHHHTRPVAVPEPNSALLLLAGALALVISRRIAP